MGFNFLMIDFGGELAALGAALLWAVSAVIYAQLGQKIPPLALNLSKGAIAIALIVLTLIVQGNTSPTGIEPLALGFLLLSGIVGIGLGDTFYFEGLNNLGARRTLLVQALAPPLTALIALIFLQEALSLGAWLGIFLTVLGVAWVISERVPGTDGSAINPARGISFSLLSVLGQASGAVLSRAALAETAITPFGVRCYGSSVACWCYSCGFLGGDRPTWGSSPFNPNRCWALLSSPRCSAPTWESCSNRSRSNTQQRELPKHCWQPAPCLCCLLRSGWVKWSVPEQF